MVLFKKNGVVINLEKDSYESEECFSARGWFVVSKKPKTKEEYDEAVKLSRIYVGVKFFNRVYSDTLMKQME